jgi:hypothetical protein
MDLISSALICVNNWCSPFIVGVFISFILSLTITEEEGEKIADAVNIPWANVKFNHTIGSIFLPLREMEIRFNDCNPEEKSILRAIKRLFDSGIYKAKRFFPHDWIKIVCRKK